MKAILHVIDTTGPGGAETIFIELADRLRALGYRSVVLIRGPGWVHDELERRHLTPLVIDAKGAFNWRFLRELIRIIRRERIDVIQSHLLGSNVYCALAGLLTRRPVIATFHGKVDVNPNERLRGLKFRLMNWGVRRFVAVSNSLSTAIHAEGLLNPAKTEVIYNGIDLSRYGRGIGSGLRRLLGLGDDAILIGSLGNVRPAKGYDVLVRAVRPVIDSFPHAHFLIAGDIKASLMTELESLMRSEGVAEHIHFLGYSSNSAEFLSQVDLFVLSSLSEGFSISTIEALATGLPAIVTRCGGPEEIVTDGVDALMVEPGNPGALADGLKALLNDEARARSLAEAGKARVGERFGMDTMLARYIALYTEAR